MDSGGDNLPVSDNIEALLEDPNEAHSVMAFSKMETFRKRGQLCDVVIRVGGREFPAHRVVLAATSDYFDAMFSSGMAESAQLEVELKSISPDVMEALLDYVYTGRVRVSMDNVQDLLPAASLVQMEGVKLVCSNFLLSEVDVSNVLGIRRFAELHCCSDLEQFTSDYAAHNFDLIVEYEEFLCITHDELLNLIIREDLRIDTEESVYKAVMRWIDHRAAERSCYLPEFLRLVRLPVMSVRFLTDVIDNDPLIRQSMECRDLVDVAKRFHLRPDLRCEMQGRYYCPRDGGDEYLVVIGGFGSDQNPSDSVEMFNPRSEEWSELPDLPISYRYVAACSLDTCVYVIGGFDGRERLNTVCLLDMAQRSEGWRWLTPMHYKRGLSAACTHKGLIYVCGGFDGETRLRSLEVYHPKINEWRILEDMTTAREGAGLVVVDETLYCLGGYDGFHLLNSMEAFDLRRGTWSACKPMYMRRSGAGCALLGDTIYVCGGYGGAEGRGPLHLDTVEAYNTWLAQWTMVSDMNLPRCYVGACVLAGKIYVAAGYNGSRLLDTVESYDPVENTWFLHEGSRMNNERCDTGMCVVRFLGYTELSTLTPPTSASATATHEAISRQSTGNPLHHQPQRIHSDIASGSSNRIPMTDPELAASQVSDEPRAGLLDRFLAHQYPFMPVDAATSTGNSTVLPGSSSSAAAAASTNCSANRRPGVPHSTDFPPGANSPTARWYTSPLHFRARRGLPTPQHQQLHQVMETQFVHPSVATSAARSLLSTNPTGLPMQRPARPSGLDGLHRGLLPRGQQQQLLSADGNPASLARSMPRGQHQDSGGPGARLPRLYLMLDEQGNRQGGGSGNSPDLLVRMPFSLTTIAASDQTESDGSVELASIADEVMPAGALIPPANHDYEAEFEDGDDDDGEELEQTLGEELESTGAGDGPLVVGAVAGSCGSLLTACRADASVAPPCPLTAHHSDESLSTSGRIHRAGGGGYGTAPLGHGSGRRRLSRSDCDLARWVRKQKPTTTTASLCVGQDSELVAAEALALTGRTISCSGDDVCDSRPASSTGRQAAPTPGHSTSSRSLTPLPTMTTRCLAGRPMVDDAAAAAGGGGDKIQTSACQAAVGAVEQQEQQQLMLPPVCTPDHVLSLDAPSSLVNFADSCAATAAEGNREFRLASAAAAASLQLETVPACSQQAVHDQPIDVQSPAHGLGHTSPARPLDGPAPVAGPQPVRPSLAVHPTVDADAEQPEDLRSDGEGEEQ